MYVFTPLRIVSTRVQVELYGNLFDSKFLKAHARKDYTLVNSVTDINSKLRLL